MTTERRSRTTPSADAQSSSGALTGYEAELWRMADALRGSMDAADYKHVAQEHFVATPSPRSRGP